jgi:hypothetical protein
MRSARKLLHAAIRDSSQISGMESESDRLRFTYNGTVTAIGLGGTSS